MGTVRFNLLSQSLKMHVNVTVILPTMDFGEMMDKKAAEVYAPGLKFQTLWLLHGFAGDDADWLTYSSVARYAEANKLAVIMPSAANSSYVNTAYGHEFYNYVAEELPLTMRALLPLSDKREDNFIAGLSMGGDGAMQLAIKRPDMYSRAVCLSGASLSGGAITERILANEGMRNLKTIYGDMWDGLEGSEHDAFAIAKASAARGDILPKFYFACGDDDFALDTVKNAHAYLSSLGYDSQLETVPGYGHEWEFWDIYIKKAIEEWLEIKKRRLYE